VAAQAPGADRLTPTELEELLGPIALYPDPLLANVLAASVYPDEVAAAAKFIADGGNPDQVDSKPWEDPVKAVAKIPTPSRSWGQYKDWTTLWSGLSGSGQGRDGCRAVAAQESSEKGNLQTTPQQKVVVEQEVIYIKPADPEIIMFPSYSPSVVYVEDHHDDVVAAGVIGFWHRCRRRSDHREHMDCTLGWGIRWLWLAWRVTAGGYYGGNNDVNIIAVGTTSNPATSISAIEPTLQWQSRRQRRQCLVAEPLQAECRPTAQPGGGYRGGAGATNRPATPGGRPAGGVGQAGAWGRRRRSTTWPSAGGAGGPSAGQQPARSGGVGQGGAGQQPAGWGAGRTGAAQQPARPGAQAERVRFQHRPRRWTECGQQPANDRVRGAGAARPDTQRFAARSADPASTVVP